jgi:hypothetical protein
LLIFIYFIPSRKKATFAPPATPHTTIKGKTLTGTNTAPVMAAQTSTLQQSALPPAPPAVDMENFAPARNQSRDSEGTIYTSVTAVKDRSSTGSVTVVQESN